MTEETKTNEPEIKLPKFQIVEGKLFINGVKLPGVTKLDMSVEASTKVATINLTVIADVMNMSDSDSKVANSLADELANKKDLDYEARLKKLVEKVDVLDTIVHTQQTIITTLL